MTRTTTAPKEARPAPEPPTPSRRMTQIMPCAPGWRALYHHDERRPGHRRDELHTREIVSWALIDRDARGNDYGSAVSDGCPEGFVGIVMIDGLPSFSDDVSGPFRFGGYLGPNDHPHEAADIVAGLPPRSSWYQNLADDEDDAEE